MGLFTQSGPTSYEIRSEAQRIGDHASTIARRWPEKLTTETGDEITVSRSARLDHYRDDEVTISMEFQPPHARYGSYHSFTVRGDPTHWATESDVDRIVERLSEEHDTQIALAVGDVAATGQFALFPQQVPDALIAHAGERA